MSHSSRILFVSCVAVVLIGVAFFAHTDTHAQAQTLYETGFSDGQFTDWTLNTTTNATISQVDDDPALVILGEAPNYTSAILRGSNLWANYALDARLQIATTNRANPIADAALIVRGDSVSSDLIAVFFSATHDEITLARVIDDQIIASVSAPYAITQGQWYSVRVAAWETQIDLSIDGEPVLQTQFKQPPVRGNAGILVFPNSVAYLDDVRVSLIDSTDQATLPTLQPTNTAPAAPTDAFIVLSTNTPPHAPEIAVTPTDAPPATTTTAPDRITATISASVPFANVRRGPGTDYPVVATATAGDIFYVVMQTTTPDDQVWYLIEIGAGQAWVWAEMVTIQPAGAQIPHAQ